jgi:hypothetical protein
MHGACSRASCAGRPFNPVSGQHPLFNNLQNLETALHDPDESAPRTAAAWFVITPGGTSTHVSAHISQQGIHRHQERFGSTRHLL